MTKKGYFQSQIHRQRISASLRGRHFTQEWKDRISEGARRIKLDAEAIRTLYWGQGKTLREIAITYGVSADSVWCYMKRQHIPRRPSGKMPKPKPTKVYHPRHYSEEAKAKMSLAKLGKPLSEEHKRKIGEASKGRKWTHAQYEKMRNALSGPNNPMFGKKGERNPFFGKHHSAETKLQISSNTERSRKIAISQTGLHKPGKENAIAGRHKIAAAKREHWRDPVKRESLIKAILCGLQIKPNKAEILLGSILTSVAPDEFRYVGDGQLIVAGLCPDFVNVNGRKEVIEMFGDYWHRGENPEDRVSAFSKYGYRTLVIWEHELKDLVCVKQRITSWLGKE